MRELCRRMSTLWRCGQAQPQRTRHQREQLHEELSASMLAHIFLPGIPYHGLVVWELEFEVSGARATRMKRTAGFEMEEDMLFLLTETEEIEQRLDIERPALGCLSGLPERWKTWHERAERCCELAVEKGAFQNGGEKRREAKVLPRLPGQWRRRRRGDQGKR